MYLSKHAGKWVETPEAQTIADGIAVKSPGKITFDLIQKYVDDIFVVKDDDIAATILLMMERVKMISCMVIFPTRIKLRLLSAVVILM